MKSTLPNTVLAYFGKNRLLNCSSEFKPYYSQRYVVDIFVFFTLPEQSEAFSNSLNGRHANMPITIENEKQNRMSFLDVQLFMKIKHSPLLFTLNLSLREFMHLDSFLPSTYKFGILHKLAYRCFQICSSWTKLHTELVYLKQIFLKNGSPEKIANKCFKSFINNIHVVKEINLTVEKKSFVLVLPYLGSASLKSRTKLKKSLKTSLIVVNCK